MSDLYWLTDAQIVRLEPYFPKSQGKPRVDDRKQRGDLHTADARYFCVNNSRACTSPVCPEAV